MGVVELPLGPGVYIEISDELARERSNSTILHAKPSIALRTSPPESVRSNNRRLARSGVTVGGLL